MISSTASSDEENVAHVSKKSFENTSRPRDVNVVDWESCHDPDNPFNWPLSKKWITTLISCFVTLVVGINGTAITSAAQAINEEFGVSDESFPNSYWPVTSWNIGAALFPLITLPLMETFGVRRGYLISYGVFVISIIPQAVASNFATLIIIRVFSGGCAGILENITGGIVSDTWEGERDRSFPMALYIWSLLTGVTVGPVIGGGIIHHLSWRWIFHTQLIIYGITFLLPLMLLPESRPNVILKTRAKHMRRQTHKKVYAAVEVESSDTIHIIREAVTRPLHMLFTEYVVASFTAWSAFCFGTAFIFTQSIPQVYNSLYTWSPYSTGIVQIAVVVGETLGLLATIPQDRLYFRSAKHNTDNLGSPVPEARLYLSIVGSLFGITAGFFWYGWTSYPFLPWILPTAGLALVGFGIFTVVAAATNYLTDSYSLYAASALAAVAFGENMFAAFLPLATQSMYTVLGFQWASSLLGFAALALSFAPVVLMFYGREVRKRSPFMREAIQK